MCLNLHSFAERVIAINGWVGFVLESCGWEYLFDCIGMEYSIALQMCLARPLCMQGVGG